MIKKDRKRVLRKLEKLWDMKEELSLTQLIHNVATCVHSKQQKVKEPSFSDFYFFSNELFESELDYTIKILEDIEQEEQ